MVLSTPSEHYNQNRASALLEGLSDETVSRASTILLDFGVLSKVVYDPNKSRPGKMLRISDMFVYFSGLLFLW